MSTFLEMIDSFAVIAFSHLFANQPRHHASHPLFPQHCILRSPQGLVVVEINTIERGRHLRLLGEEELRLGRRHLERHSHETSFRQKEAVDCTFRLNPEPLGGSRDRLTRLPSTARQASSGTLCHPKATLRLTVGVS